MQHTLRRPFTVRGTGLHTGVRASLRVEPADVDSGITFVRADLRPQVEIPARIEYAADGLLCTTLGRDGATVKTVEHLLASLYALGVDNARVVVDGPEIPILDGSAGPFVREIVGAGRACLDAPRRAWVVARPVAVGEGDRWARLEPADSFCVSSTIVFSHPAVGTQHFELAVTPDAFAEKLAPARTFGFLRDKDRLRADGHALGATDHNVLVFDESSVVSIEGLRFLDEPARHKALDAIGDLALLGAPLRGRYVSHKGGHALNRRLVTRLRAEVDTHRCEECA